ncbi:hypothetical protein O1611_g3995 [Lasiodiplodia mahajangana]|uniref:Uncharacterized protein n=1 Tax=Lasiodiplodia mahajangana TaxID=1108764 RepID=A0ACC2JQ50_9PEZI|nr:hypothetical protein O1611_g3995 [Lasiodiplodia mahajangana]
MTVTDKGQSSGKSRKRGTDEVEGSSRVESTNVNITDDQTTPRLPHASFRFAPPPPTKHTASPVKITDQLKRLETPVYHQQLTKKDFENDPCLKDVESLYSSIKKATQLRGIIPNEVRADVEKADPENDLEDDDLAAQEIYERRFLEPADAEAHARIRATFQTLLIIQQQAGECVELSRHETGWNNFVHTPLLSLVFTDRRKPPPTVAPLAVGTRLEAAMSATIQADSIPIIHRVKAPVRGEDAITDAYILTIEGTQISKNAAEPDTDTIMPLQAQTTVNVDLTTAHSRSDAKRVDYVVVMDIFDENTGLKDRIEELNTYIWTEFKAPYHVNQTAYKAVADSSIALSIETKKALSQDEPLLQLGIWTAAWHKRMSFFRQLLATFTIGAAPEWFQKRLISVPLIQVVGHEWDIYFACFSNQVTIYGPLRIGSTASMVQLYTLVASLQAIREWIKTAFRKGMEDWFVCGVPEDT